MAGPAPIFDTALQRRRLKRAVAGEIADFLLARTVEDIAERLATVRRKFVAIADIGTPGLHLAHMLASRWPSVEAMRLAPIAQTSSEKNCMVGDPEHLPLKPLSFDLAISALALQTANDLPGALIQIRQVLKPDGLFLGAILGGRTLQELRSVLTEAEATVCGGTSPRVAPFADVRDLGALLQRAGFALPVADSDSVTIRYRDLFALMADLRAMGATNPLCDRIRRPTRREIFLKADNLYRDRFADTDGRIRATFEIISMSGWSPHESQQQPARRGSGQVSLAKLLGKPTAKKTL